MKSKTTKKRIKRWAKRVLRQMENAVLDHLASEAATILDDMLEDCPVCETRTPPPAPTAPEIVDEKLKANSEYGKTVPVSNGWETIHLVRYNRVLLLSVYDPDRWTLSRIN